MKVSDRQWQVGDRLRVTQCLLVHQFEANVNDHTGDVVKISPKSGDLHPLLVDFGGHVGQTWLGLGVEVELVMPEKTTPPTIEQLAVRLAEVYRDAFRGALSTFPECSWKPSDPANCRQAAHEIAMLLVGQSLKGER